MLWIILLVGIVLFAGGFILGIAWIATVVLGQLRDLERR